MAQLEEIHVGYLLALFAVTMLLHNELACLRCVVNMSPPYPLRYFLKPNLNAQDSMSVTNKIFKNDTLLLSP